MYAELWTWYKIYERGCTNASFLVELEGEGENGVHTE